jgi:hypothetical protein
MSDWTVGLYMQWVADGYSMPGNPYPYDVWCTHRYNFTPPTICLANPQKYARGWIAATVGSETGPVTAWNALPNGSFNGGSHKGSQQIREMLGDGAKPHAVTEIGERFPDPLTVAPQGAWVSGTTYLLNQSVTTGDGHGYVCIDHHTASSANKPGVGASWQNEWFQDPVGDPPSDWIAIFDSAVVEYDKERTPIWMCVFTGFDHIKGDNGKLYGLWSTEDDGSHNVKDTGVLAEYTRLTTWRPTSSTLTQNSPSDWSNQDAGWSIPIQDIPSNLAGMRRVLDRVVQNGVKLLITDFPWSDIQPTNPLVGGQRPTAGNNNTFTGWAKHDQLMDECEARGIYVIAGCQYTPDWAKSTGAGNNKVPPDRDLNHYADYAYFCWAVVDRYQTRNPNVLIAISVWNEPNISNFWQDPRNNNGPYVPGYAKMLIGAYDAVHNGVVHAAGGDRNLTAHPEVMVGNGGMAVASGTGANGSSYGWPQWVQGLIDAGATFSFDVFFVHPYMWLCDATRTDFAWNPFNYIQPCYTKFKNAGRNDIFAWATEIGGSTRAQNSGTNAAGTFDCSTGHNGPSGVGGYDSGAPGPGYNTNDQAVTYSTMGSRVDAYVAEVRSTDFYDSGRGLNWIGPLLWWSMNDEAPSETNWTSPNNDWTRHAGLFFHGTDGTDGAAKPMAQQWANHFANTGSPGSSHQGPDTEFPTTFVASINGFDVATSGSVVPMGFATGGGLPKQVGATYPEIDAEVLAGAKFIRPSLTWDAGSTNVNGTFDKTSAIDALVAYCASKGIGIVLTIGAGPTYGGSMHTQSVNFAAFVAAVAAHFNGNSTVWAIEVGNEWNHDLWSSAVGATKLSSYAELLIRIFDPLFHNVRNITDRPVIVGGLGGETASGNGITSYAATTGLHATWSVGGHSITLGLTTHYDGWNDHPYSYDTMPSDDDAGSGRGWYNLLQEMTWFWATFGALPPLWITEIGYPTNTPGTQTETDAQQQAAANLMTDAMNLLGGYLTNGSPRTDTSGNTGPWQVECFAWFTAMNNNKPGQTTSNDNWFGILEYNADWAAAQPKPHVYTTYGSLAAGNGGTPKVTVSGTQVPLGIYASDTGGSGLKHVYVYVDGRQIGEAQNTGFGYGYGLNTLTAGSGGVPLTNADHTLTSVAVDGAGNRTTSAAVTFAVLNGTGQQPIVTDVTTPSGNDTVSTAGGTTITALGNFFTGASVVVEVGTVGSWAACSSVAVANDGKSLTAVVPAHAGGVVHVRVTVDGGTPSKLTPADKVTYGTVGPGPVITGLSSDFGPIAGGKVITITASAGLGTVSAVAFGTTPAAAFTQTSSTTVQATTPAMSAALVDIRVTNGAGQSGIDAADAFNVEDSPDAALTGIVDQQHYAGPAVPVTIQVSNTADPDPTVQLLIDGALTNLTPTRVDSSGTPDPTGDYYLFYVNVAAQTPTSHTIQGQATDADSQTGQSSLVTYFADSEQGTNEAPTGLIVQPSTGAQASGNAFAFGVQATDDHDTIIPSVQLWVTQTTEVPAPASVGFALGAAALGAGALGAIGGQGGTTTEVITPLILLGSASWQSDTSYLLLWNSFVLANAVYEVRAKLTDSQGAFSWTPAITITVNNVPTTQGGGPIGTDPRTPYRLYSRSHDFQRTGRIDKISEFDATLIFNDVGPWTLRIPERLEDPDTGQWTPNPAVALLLAPQAGVMLYWKDTVVVSGPVTGYKWGWDASGAVFEFRGYDDNRILDNTVIQQSPTTAAPDGQGHWPKAFDSIRGPAEDVILHYIDANVGPSAITARKQPNLTVAASSHRGATIQANGRNQNLLAACQSWANQSPTAPGVPKLGFRIRAQDGAATAEVYMPQDKRSLVRFSPKFGNVASFGIESSAPDANVVYAGGNEVDQLAGTSRLRAFAEAAITVGSDPRPKKWLPGDRIIISGAADPSFNLDTTITEIYIGSAATGDPGIFRILYDCPGGDVADTADSIVITHVFSVPSSLGQRLYQVVQDDASISQWGRREQFQAHADLITLTDLNAAAAGDLKAAAPPPALSVEPIDTESTQFVRDYMLGDQVTVVPPLGTPYGDVIVQVAITLSQTGAVIKPSVGAVPQGVLATVAEARRLAATVDALQTT